MPSRKLLAGLVALCCLAPFVVGFSLFFPVFGHYHTPRVSIEPTLVTQLSENVTDNRPLFDELHTFRLIGSHEILQGADLVSKATEILDGNISVPLYSETPVRWPFSLDDIESVPGSLQLSLSALVPASILLDAYRQTGNEAFLDAAIDDTRDFLEMEHGMWLPRGLIWNDHAIAARSMFFCRLLIELASAGSPARNDVQEGLLEALDRHVRLLAKDRHFTFRSNHGLMQSIGVLFAAITAPSLPSVRENLDKVISRTDQQLELLVTIDGAFTEHSAGYQEFNLHLLAQAIRGVRILTGDVPVHWIERYVNALDFYRHLRRPDGTLPRHGDTGGATDPIFLGADQRGAIRLSTDADFAVKNTEPVWVDPGLGYWSEWSADSHMLATWANFPSGVHKHADEMSLHFWSLGEDWLTSVGYWPYGHPLRNDAIGWRGSNAPHALSESRNSSRDTVLRAQYRDADVTLLHLQRKNSDGYTVDRVLVRTGTTWFVIDSGDGTDAPTNTVWQLSPTVEASEWQVLDGMRLSILRSVRSPSALTLQAMLGSGAGMSQVRGERDPFGGWVMYGGVPQPALALVLTAPAGSWSGLAWSSAAASDPTDSMLVRDIQWESANDWVVEIGNTASTTLERRDQQLTIRAGSTLREVQLDGTSASGSIEAAKRAYAIAEQGYPPYRDFLPWRFKVFWFAMAAAVLQLIVLLALWRWLRAHPRTGAPLLFSLFVAHCALAAWLHVVYFAAP